MLEELALEMEEETCSRKITPKSDLPTYW